MAFLSTMEQVSNVRYDNGRGVSENYNPQNDTERLQTRMMFHFATEEHREANQLRRALLSIIPIYAVDTVTFIDNMTSMPSEMVAHRTGLCVIKQEMLPPLPEGEFIYQMRLMTKGAGPVDILQAKYIKNEWRDLPNPFFQTKLLVMTAGQNLVCDINIRKASYAKFITYLPGDVKANIDTNITHIKYIPVSIATYEKNPNGGFNFIVEPTGSLHLDQILPAVFENMTL